MARFKSTIALSVLCLLLSLPCLARKTEYLNNSSDLKENTVYKVKRDIDLNGQSLHIPKGCSLVFRGGSISNGVIYFDSTIIKGPPVFKNCTYDGIICIKKISDRDFTSNDDNSTFRFLFTNAVLNGVKCNLYRDYIIRMNEVQGYTGLVNIEDINSGADIVFHGIVYNKDTFVPADLKPVIVLRNVNNLTIQNCYFRDADGHNTHRFTRSSGCTFIQCYGDCDNVNLLNCTQVNGDCFLRSGVWVHDVNNPKNTPRFGLTNSKIDIKSENAGYCLALYCGDGLNINVEAESPHRGLYCAGVSNSIIKYKGHNPIETKCHILIKDAVYLRRNDDDNDTLDMRGCHDLKINVEIDSLLSEERVICFQSYGSGRKEHADYRFRSDKCHHFNIDFTANIHNYPNEGYCVISCFATESGALDYYDTYGCKTSNIRIHDIKHGGGLSKKYIVQTTPYTESSIDLVNCDLTGNNRLYDYGVQIIGTSSGNISMKNCNIGFIDVKKKEYGVFIIDVVDSKIESSLINYDDQSSRDLVRINY